MPQYTSSDPDVRIATACETRESPRVRLGLADWRRPELLDTFYPAELPEEWRLSYYASQFTCVWLDHSAWADLTPALAQQWREDTGRSFRFVLEAGDPGFVSGQGSEAGEALARLGERLAGVMDADHPSLIWLEPDVDLRTLNDVLRRWLDGEGWGGDLYLLARKVDLATLEQVETLLGLYSLG